METGGPGDHGASVPAHVEEECNLLIVTVMILPQETAEDTAQGSVQSTGRAMLILVHLMVSNSLYYVFCLWGDTKHNCWLFRQEIFFFTLLINKHFRITIHLKKNIRHIDKISI